MYFRCVLGPSGYFFEDELTMPSSATLSTDDGSTFMAIVFTNHIAYAPAGSKFADFGLVCVQ